MSGIVLYNSVITDPSFGDMIAVPSGNYGSGVFPWESADPAVRGPGVVRIPRGAQATLPATYESNYYLWIMHFSGSGSGSGSGSVLMALSDTFSLGFAMNARTGQTVYTYAPTGATFYRVFDAEGQALYVLGQVVQATMPLSRDPVGPVGTFVHPGLGLRWTNVYNQPDIQMADPVPPGFILENPGGGSSWMPPPSPIVIYNSPDNSPRLLALVVVPSSNYGSSVLPWEWELARPPLQGPGIQYVQRGELITLPTGEHDYDIWGVVTSGAGSSGGSGAGSDDTSIIPLVDTLTLKYSMNDYNQQTAVPQGGTGTTFFRAFTPAGADVFVCGHINKLSGPGQGVGGLGTYFYAPLQLTWTNINNRGDHSVPKPIPPGFVLVT